MALLGYAKKTIVPSRTNAFPARPGNGVHFNPNTAHARAMAAQASRVPRLAALNVNAGSLAAAKANSGRKR